MDRRAELPRWRVLPLMLRWHPWKVGPESLRMVCGLAVLGPVGAYLVHWAWTVGGPIFLALLVAGLGHFVRLFAMDVAGRA